MGGIGGLPAGIPWHYREMLRVMGVPARPHWRFVDRPRRSWWRRWLALALLAGCAAVPPAHTPGQEIGEAARQYAWCAAKYPRCLFWSPERRLELYLADHPDGFELEE